MGADVGIAAVGAGAGEAPGTVHLGLALGERVETREVRLPGDRERVRQYAVISLLDCLRQSLLLSQESAA